MMPYSLARAKFNFSKDEMKILIFIIRSFAASYNHQLDHGFKSIGNPDLFGNIHFQRVKVTDIGKNDRYLRTKKAFISLNNKLIRVISPDGEYEAHARLIEMPRYYNGKGLIDFTLNRDLIPFFESLAYGFVYFNVETLFKLNYYAQRLYILMCQSDNDNGFIKIHAKQFRDMLDIGDKYSRFIDFRNWVIKPAEKKITTLFMAKECKLKFTFDEVNSTPKTKDDDWDRMLHFKVVSIYNEKRRSGYTLDTEESNFIVYILARIYENNHPLLTRYVSFIGTFSQENKAMFHERLERLYHKFVNEKISINNNPDCQKLISTILKQDFGYENQAATWVTSKV